MTIIFVTLALATGGALLARDSGVGIFPGLSRGAASAAPLLSGGIAFLILQLIIRARLKDLLKNVLLAATFILWGIVQLIPQNFLSIRLGNVVVPLFVLDLAWATMSGVNSPPRPTCSSPQSQADCGGSKAALKETVQTTPD
jgi:hypothetical protein